MQRLLVSIPGLEINQALIFLGIINWDRYVNLARNSNVPKEFHQALHKAGGNSETQVRKFFQRTFRTPDATTYAVCYAQTISLIKYWLSSKQSVMEAFGSLDVSAQGPDYADRLGDIIDLHSALSEMEKNAIKTCGLLAEIEEFSKAPNIFREFRAWLRWLIDVILGKRATQYQLAQTALWVESFYSDRKNITGLKLKL